MAKNSGFQVELPEELMKYYQNKNQPHITVSIGEVDGVKGKPVETGTLEFEEIEEPIEISAKLGYFVFGKGKIMGNEIFEEEKKMDQKEIDWKKLRILEALKILKENGKFPEKGEKRTFEEICDGDKELERKLSELILGIEDDRFLDRCDWYTAWVLKTDDGYGAGHIYCDFQTDYGDMWEIQHSVTDKEFEEFYYSTIDIAKLGAAIGMEEQEKTLPNGKVIKSLVWDQENLKKAVKAVSGLSGEGKPVRITGAAPAWLVSALTHTVHPCQVSLYDPKLGKDIPIPQLSHGEPNLEGEVAFKVTEKGEAVLIEWNIDHESGVYDENNLPKVVVPEVPQGKAVYISGRGPNYLTVAMAEAYAHTNSSVSLNQPGIGYTCSITHTRSKGLGDLTKDPVGKEEIKEGLKSEKDKKAERVPGE